MAARIDRDALKLFLDLDGVLADFARGVETVTGMRPEALPVKAMWRALAAAPAFYETLEPMADAQELWAYCRPYHPTILTGLPLGSWAPPQKRRWVARMLGPDVPVITCMTRDKHRYSGPNHVLIDDRASTRDAWKKAGGTFILHVDAARSIAALQRLGL